MCTTTEVSGVPIQAVSPRLLMKDQLHKEAKKLASIPLVQLNCSFGIVTAKDDTLTLETVVRQSASKSRSKVVLVYAIRRPGCGGCREHAQQLSELSESLTRTSMIGIVKERGIDDASLLDFYSEYFKFPIYQDEKWNIFKAMGGRKISIWQMLRGYMRSRKRHAKKGIQTTMNVNSDGWIQGGLLIFDKNGVLRYAYDEVYGEEFDIPQIRAAIEAAKKNLARDDSSAGSKASADETNSSSSDE